MIEKEDTSNISQKRRNNQNQQDVHSKSSESTSSPSSSTYKPSNPPKTIVMFDGVCNVCDHFMQFVYSRDPQKHFSFQALQTVKGKEILDYHGIPNDLSSLILIEEETGTSYSKSTAVLRIMYNLKYPYPLLYGFNYILPTPIRDYCYMTFAKYRYFILGKKDSCILRPDLKERFIDWKSPMINQQQEEE